MSGNHWCPVATASIWAGGADHCTPSGELRTKILACPAPFRALHTTCTPPASAATAELLVNRENVSPVGQANGPSPQSLNPLPLNWLESNRAMFATLTGAENEAPWFVEREKKMALFPAKPLYCDHATYTFPLCEPPVWSTVRLILSWNSPAKFADGVPRLTSTVRS